MPSKKLSILPLMLLDAWLLEYDDGGDVCLRNGGLSLDYMAFQPRGPYCSGTSVRTGHRTFRISSDVQRALRQLKNMQEGPIHC
jgi:hypothetical protein